MIITGKRNVITEKITLSKVRPSAKIINTAKLNKIGFFLNKFIIILLIFKDKTMEIRFYKTFVKLLQKYL